MTMIPGPGHNAAGITIEIEVRLLNSLRRFAGAEGWRPRLRLAAGATVADALRQLGVPAAAVYLALRNGRDVTPGLVGAAIDGEQVLEHGDTLALSGPVPFSFGYGAPVV